jgi:3-oxoacyl-[acyl-carrier-protein] synthase II
VKTNSVNVKETPNSELRTPNLATTHRVVVTGLGIISSIGIGREEFWKQCLQGTSGIKPVRGFDVSSYRSRLGGQLPEIDFKAFIKPVNLRRMDRIGKIIGFGQIRALDDSGLDLKGEIESHGAFIWNRPRVPILLTNSSGLS